MTIYCNFALDVVGIRRVFFVSALQLKVTHKQLVLFHGAFAAYFSCNHTALDALLTEFKEKIDDMEDGDLPAWLEELPSRPAAN